MQLSQVDNSLIMNHQAIKRFYYSCFSKSKTNVGLTNFLYQMRRLIWIFSACSTKLTQNNPLPAQRIFTQNNPLPAQRIFPQNNPPSRPTYGKAGLFCENIVVCFIIIIIISFCFCWRYFLFFVCVCFVFLVCFSVFAL